MQAFAVVMHGPGDARLDRIDLDDPGPADVVVDIDHSGISAGTERLLWTGRMPDFPGMGYPLVPGYESVGRIAEAGSASGLAIGETVFVPGAACFGPVRGLFGGAASRLVVPAARVTVVEPATGAEATLLALAATARHAIGDGSPSLIVGHGVLGRLLARITIALGRPAPVVVEQRADRRGGGDGYTVLPTIEDTDPHHASIVDASGDASLIDRLVRRMARGGEIVLAGFYPGRIDFAFAPAFMREARLRCAAEWQPTDLADVRRLVADGLLSLDGLISHRAAAADAATAYRTAFEDPDCLKMVLDWSAA